MTLAAFAVAMFPRQTAKESLRKRSLATESGPAMIVLPGCALPLGSAETKAANVLPGFSSKFAYNYLPSPIHRRGFKEIIHMNSLNESRSLPDGSSFLLQ
jgi:hypothetical protein